MSTYQESGVDMDKAEYFKKQMIKPRTEAAWSGGGRPIGRFAGRGDIPPLAKKLSFSTDGVGTKTILGALLEAMLVEAFTGLGQDAVAMAAVDTYVDGAFPYYALDTIKVAHLEPEKHIKIIEGIIQGCQLAGCRLIGGETAQLPDMFKYPWMVDVDVSVVGFPSTESVFIPVEAKQRVYGWPSYGPASNGFSLLRRIFGLTFGEGFLQPLRERWRWEGSTYGVLKKLEHYWSELQSTLAEALLKPTPIWIPQMEEARKRGARFAGHAHITGGGMQENIVRILGGSPKAKVVIDRSRWQRPPIFALAQAVGKVLDEEMDRVFNQGIMVISILPINGPGLNGPAILIGEIQRRKGEEPQVQLVGNYVDM